jgi:glycosyltransferase involved in cell wall biosynthesis
LTQEETPKRSELCSVVIPAYNASHHVGPAIESVLAQTYPYVEVVVVDDGSTDDTAAVLERFGRDVIVVRTTNAGPGAARNVGLRHARGDRVAFLDSDDLWAPRRLERCIEQLDERPEIDFVTTDAALIVDDVVTAQRFYGDLVDPRFPEPDEQLQMMVDHNFLFVSVVANRHAVDAVGGFDENRALMSSEDYDLWMRLLLAGARAALIREPLASYRLRSDSLSANTPENWSSHLRVLEKHLPELWRRGIRARGGIYFEIAARCEARREHRRALDFLWLGLRVQDLSVRSRARATARFVVDSARRTA